MSERIWSFALTKTEVFAAIVEHIEKTRGVKLPIGEGGMIHLVTHSALDPNGGSYEFWSEKIVPPKPRQPFRWPWQRPAPPTQGGER